MILSAPPMGVDPGRVDSPGPFIATPTGTAILPLGTAKGISHDIPNDRLK